jgi:hypothetical protein
MAWFLLVTLIVLPAIYAQDKKDNLALGVPHTTTHIPIDCSDTSVLWEKVPRVSLSKEAVVDIPADGNLPPVLDAMKPIAAIVQMKDPSKPASKLPPEIESKLDNLHEQYAFQWDEKRLYGYVEIADHDWDNGHPPVSGNDFKRSPSEASSSDLFFSSVIVQIGAPSWQRLDHRDARSCAPAKGSADDGDVFWAHERRGNLSRIAWRGHSLYDKSRMDRKILRRVASV